MSMGLGHHYFVHVVKWFYGALDECIQFMKENEPKNELQWFELKPIVKLEKGKPVKLKEYQCILVEDSK